MPAATSSIAFAAYIAATVQRGTCVRGVLAGVVGVLLLSAPPAFAGRAELVDQPGCVPTELNQGCKYATVIASRYVHYEAGVGERNVVTLSGVRRASSGEEQFEITDAEAGVVAGAGCERVDASTARCARAHPEVEVLREMVRVELGDLEDSLVAGPSTLVSAGGGPGADVLRAGVDGSSLDGGPGDDAILGGPGDDSLRGGEGDDSIVGAGGADGLVGGPGRDLVNGGSGDDGLRGSDGSFETVGDQLTGGDGRDIVDYYGSGEEQGVRVDLRRGFGGGGTALDRLRGIEDAKGSAGPDVLIGDARGNRLEGFLGMDRVKANGGDDEVVAAERVSCGPGADRVESPSSRFALPRECELIKPDLFAPELLIRTYPLRLSGGRLAFLIPCSARARPPCITRVTLHALSSARGGNVGERLGTSGPVAVRPATSRSVVVRLTATARNRLKRARTPLRVRIAQSRTRAPAYAITLGG